MISLIVRELHFTLSMAGLRSKANLPKPLCIEHGQ
jgi:hypothetical protein